MFYTHSTAQFDSHLMYMLFVRRPMHEVNPYWDANNYLRRCETKQFSHWIQIILWLANHLPSLITTLSNINQWAFYRPTESWNYFSYMASFRGTIHRGKQSTRFLRHFFAYKGLYHYRKHGNWNLCRSALPGIFLSLCKCINKWGLQLLSTSSSDFISKSPLEMLLEGHVANE